MMLGPRAPASPSSSSLDVDWQRQARQFLPSYTSDSLLQIYLGPDTVVQEVSAPLLEDDTPQARLAPAPPVEGDVRPAAGAGHHRARREVAGRHPARRGAAPGPAAARQAQPAGRGPPCARWRRACA